MHRILFLPDIRPAGYPANPKAGYQISSRISGNGRIPDIRPDTWLDNYIFGKISKGNLVSGRIPNIKKGPIIRPDIRCIPRN
jgi:hypothetical protein